MIWQDWIFSIGQVIFLIAFIPTLKGKNKPELITSVITAFVLVIFALTYFSLKLWFSTVAAVAMTAAWTLAAWQKYQQDKK